MPTPTARDVHVDSLLTGISIAYISQEYIWERVFPRVPVQKQSDLYFIFDAGAWQRNEVAVRAPGTRARRGGYTLTTGSYFAPNYAIGTTIPDEVRANADQPLRPDVDATAWVTDQLLRGIEKRVADLTTGGSGLWNYSSSPTTQWSSDVSTPIADVEAAKTNVVQQTGRMPNTMVMSYDVWRYLNQHPDLLARFQYTNPTGIITPDQAQRLFGVDRLLIGAAIFDPAKEGQTASPSYIWGDGVWLGYVPARAALMEPAAGYVLEWQTRDVRTYREEAEKQDVVEAQHQVDEVITASTAGGILYNCV